MVAAKIKSMHGFCFIIGSQVRRKCRSVRHELLTHELDFFWACEKTEHGHMHMNYVFKTSICRSMAAVSASSGEEQGTFTPREFSFLWPLGFVRQGTDVVTRRFSATASELLARRDADENPIQQPECTVVRVVATGPDGKLQQKYSTDLMAFRPGFTPFLQLILQEENISVRLCHGCSKICEKPLRCVQCKTAIYCSKNCQIKAWQAGHKSECKQTEGKRDGVLLNFDNLSLAGLFMLVDDNVLTAQELLLVRHCI